MPSGGALPAKPVPRTRKKRALPAPGSDRRAGEATRHTSDGFRFCRRRRRGGSTVLPARKVVRLPCTWRWANRTNYLTSEDRADFSQIPRGRPHWGKVTRPGCSAIGRLCRPAGGDFLQRELDPEEPLLERHLQTVWRSRENIPSPSLLAGTGAAAVAAFALRQAGSGSREGLLFSAGARCGRR